MKNYLSNFKKTISPKKIFIFDLIRKIYNDLKNHAFIKKMFIVFLFLHVIHMTLSYFELVLPHPCLYIIEMSITRLKFLLVVLVISRIIKMLPFSEELQEEYTLFNRQPQNNPFVVLLREYHFYIFVLIIFTFFSSIYFVEDFILSYCLGILSFVFCLLYFVQFTVYTKNYLVAIKARDTITKRSFSSVTKSALVMGYELAKMGLVVGLGAEAAWKLTHGGPNAMSPWRQNWLNKEFPNDSTKIWTETKAGLALDNQAMGRPHDSSFDLDKKLQDLINKD